MNIFLNILNIFRQKIPSILQKNMVRPIILKVAIPEKTDIFGVFCLNALINYNKNLKIYYYKYLIFR